MAKVILLKDDMSRIIAIEPVKIRRTKRKVTITIEIDKTKEDLFILEV